MINLIVKKNIYTGEIIDVWDSIKKCAEDMNVKPPAIIQAIKVHGKCKDYHIERIDISKVKLLTLLNDKS